MYKNTCLIILFSTLSSAILAQEVMQDSAIIYFRHNNSQVDSDQLEKLKQISSFLKNNHGKIIHIHGFTDHTGSSNYNLKLSHKRAKAVQKALIQLGVPIKLIENVSGKGELPSDQMHRIPSDRKVEVYCVDRKFYKSIQEIEGIELQVGDYIHLDGLHFKAGKPYIIPSSAPKVKELIGFLRSHPNLQIELQGHVCCTPQKKDGYDVIHENYKLSYNRAKALYLYLQKQGIDSSRMSYMGFGGQKPLYVDEKTEYERQMNRRVEIKIVGIKQN